MRTKQLILFISLLFISGCFKESLEVSAPATGIVTLQLHDFNGDGFDPDILYFKQKEDGSYVFTLSGRSWWPHPSGRPDWRSGYLLGKMNPKGGFEPTFEPFSFPFNNDLNVYGNFDQLLREGNLLDKGLEIPRLYSIKDQMLSYSVKRADKIVTFNLNVETGEASSFVSDQSVSPVSGKAAGIFGTSDGGYMTVTEKYNNLTNPPRHYLTYSKFSSGGTLEPPSHDYPVEDSIYSDYLVDRGGDYYFVNVTPGDVVYKIEYKNQESIKLESYIELSDGKYFNNLLGTKDIYNGWFCGNFADSTLDKEGTPDFEVEIRFGPSKHQLAHRYVNSAYPDGCFAKNSIDFVYKDYVDVPFEVWDITTIPNRQLMVGFNDQGQDGTFNLINEKVCYTGATYGCQVNECVVPYDPSQPIPCVPITGASQELVTISNLPYSTTPNADLAQTGGMRKSLAYSFLPVLPLGAPMWNLIQLPESSLTISPPRGIKPSSELVEININQDSHSIVKSDFLKTDGSVVKNIYKAVPYNGGYAILCNAAGLYGPETRMPLLFFVDADPKQTGVVQLNPGAAAAEKLESNKSTNAILYSCIENKTLKLIAFKDGDKVGVPKLLSDFYQFQIEGYKCTPTNTGGWAVLAWVRPTASTRDLMFLEFDENLNLVKR